MVISAAPQICRPSISTWQPTEHLFAFINNMNSLLQIASRIEAAVQAYILVKDVTDSAVWKHHFEEERVSAICLMPGYHLSPPSHLLLN
jgi:hypothetical protein